jgi:hypothetical protein
VSEAPKDKSKAETAEDADERKVPRILFHRIIPSARPPQRADKSAMGTLPTRAFRFCEPVVTASGFGYYVFPPIGFGLWWDGLSVKWRPAGFEEWLPLNTANVSGFPQYFDANVPEEVKGWWPPFLGTQAEPGRVQVWTGLMVRTAPGWSTLVRPAANVPPKAGLVMSEGIIETDRWFGPLITNMQIVRTDIPLEFDPNFPLLQVQVLPRIALDESAQNGFVVTEGLPAFGPEDWDDYYDTVIRPHVAEHRPRGQYATAARKRKKAEGSE